jgi:hypothetical protein
VAVEGVAMALAGGQADGRARGGGTGQPSGDADGLPRTSGSCPALVVLHLVSTTERRTRFPCTPVTTS